MTEISSSLNPVDALTVDVLTDNVSDNYVSKTLFAVSEFAHVVRAGAKTISGEALLCGNLGYGLRLVSRIDRVRHTLLFDTGPDQPFLSAIAPISGSQWARSSVLR
jgi:7,8-dihydropterin-6-yl-methyl-4-(beta-D-ribofuranosyl)aminobenzene 5'-phosphate synthase